MDKNYHYKELIFIYQANETRSRMNMGATNDIFITFFDTLLYQRNNPRMNKNEMMNNRSKILTEQISFSNLKLR